MTSRESEQAHQMSETASRIHDLIEPEKSWPTQEQFDQASTLGTEYALQEIANGNIRPLEHPLGGMWADGMSERKVANAVEFKLIDGETDEAQVELGNAWEQAYFDQWRVKGWSE